MAEGEFALVRQHMESALTMSARPTGSPTGDHDYYAMLADAAALQYDEKALRKYAPLAEETATRIDHKLYTAIAHRAWGVAHRLAGEDAQARERFVRAAELFAEYPAPWQMARSYSEMGELARNQGKITEAHDHFARALSGFEKMRAAPDAARTRAAIRALDEPPYPAGLTEREVEVLRLLARGLTDQEIAGELVLSRRTVHAHLRSIYNKLDVTTRTAAARAAAENKIV